MLPLGRQINQAPFEQRLLNLFTPSISLYFSPSLRTFHYVGEVSRLYWSRLLKALVLWQAVVIALYDVIRYV